MDVTLARPIPARPRTKQPPTDGPLVCAWIETFLVHGPGDFYGQPFRLTAEERLFLYRCYERRVDGRRRYRRVLKGQPKGSGKTELGAAVGCYELGGGVHDDPVVAVAAASYDNADELFAAMRAQIGEGPLERHFDILDKAIYPKEGPGQAYRVAAAAGTNDGPKPTVLIADELHWWDTPIKKQVHIVLANGLTKRAGGWNLNITTAGSDLQTLLGELYRHGVAVQSGETRDDGFLFDWLAAPEDSDLSTDDGLRAAIIACQPGADVFYPLEQVVARFHDPEMTEYEFRRFYLNQWTATAEMWLPTGAWQARAKPETVVPDGTEITIGFDGSYNNDSSALVGCTLDGLHEFVLGVWERPARVSDWVVPRSEVSAVVDRAMRTYRVKRLACDPFGWHDEIEQWAEAYGDEVVIHWPTNEVRRMVEACSRFYTAVVNEDMTNDGNPTHASHLAHAVVKEVPAGGAYITKPSRASGQKIDVAIAGVIALEQAATLAEVGETWFF